MAKDAEVLVGIDGSHANLFGDMAPDVYDEKFADSHVRRIIVNSRLPASHSHYVRGPNALGRYVNRSFKEALDHIERHAKTADGMLGIHLAGYSRGAAMALDIANALSQPPQGWASNTARLLTFGKSKPVVQQLQRLRDRHAGRLRIASLALFDPVDMSSDIDDTWIARDVGPSAVVRRSRHWGSRVGWTNVGDEGEPGTRTPRPRLVLDGTHAALGGMPREGDIPKPLARELLKMLKHIEEWRLVDARFDQNVARHPIVRGALGGVGLFVHPVNAGLLGPGAFAAVKLLGVVKPKLSPAGGWRVRTLLTSYASEGGALGGLVSDQLSTALGKFKGIDILFSDFQKCTDKIAQYRQENETASRFARRWMAQALGQAYPARL
ncbi:MULTISPECIES: hypothetical protein [Roseomonadaceae]|uniref:DUF2235 domain-containing protein n=1 Tax=Falsiroseomonas oleicola TaxID=2801474 RepID=A0ABS6H506_9PROT|nr:hypothetical protein [Roseomonas oleicola]MBU8543751.1 hypothetical protein [Roseomonas oleicola]